VGSVGPILVRSDDAEERAAVVAPDRDEVKWFETRGVAALLTIRVERPSS